MDGSNFPAKMGQPARRALTHAGISSLEQIAELGESELLKLHGLGPKTIRQLREALSAAGLDFKK
ncbi:DNA-binding protein [Paenibacillus sp. PK3_47]|nr:DNA-binding protein [Paenibacillus sp. PK3_47]